MTMENSEIQHAAIYAFYRVIKSFSKYSWAIDIKNSINNN
jgi:hypothetical protein